MTPHKPKILYLVTEDWYFCSHRLSLACSARDAGYDVVVATRVRNHAGHITGEGLRLIPIELSRRSKNPFMELGFLFDLISLYRSERPDIVHHVALKPVIYGSVAAKVAGVPSVVNALTGMGYVFTSRELLAKALRPLIETIFRFVLNLGNSRLIIQNPDDIEMLVSANIIKPERAVLIRGSGVDIEKFSFEPEPAGTPLVVMVSRLLWDKGVKEFVDAAGLIKENETAARFVVVGEADCENPAAISQGQLEEWRKNSAVEFWGHSDNVAGILKQAHIVCLPSYREGLPKVLIEAAACGRPIVTTDVQGCREAVRHGVNGLLVPARDFKALSKALALIIADKQLRLDMGAKGREMAESEFSTGKVVKDTLAVYDNLLAKA
ncbi:MAG: glycosyltransferase family 4 protein [Nitrospirae bacterium]|nr:glycosyltransferase family 4 protein [Nitrospirota bacterium]